MNEPDNIDDKYEDELCSQRAQEGAELIARLLPFIPESVVKISLVLGYDDGFCLEARVDRELERVRDEIEQKDEAKKKET